jgi:hypothetical protein
MSCIFVGLMTPGLVNAQGFNIDLGWPYWVPAGIYSAASGQAGVWNALETGTTPGIVDTDGVASGVSVTVTADGNGSAAQWTENLTPVWNLAYGYYVDVEVRQDLVYVAKGSSLDIFDLSDNTSPVMLSSTYLPTPAEYLAIGADHVYLLSDRRADFSTVFLTAVDVSDALNPTVVSAPLPVPEGDALTVVGETVYVVVPDKLAVVCTAAVANATVKFGQATVSK